MKHISMMIDNLLKKCSNFYKASTELQVSVVKQNDAFLTELSEIKSFDDRAEFVEEKFKKLGEGSSRSVFDLGNGTILKLAINDRGIAQNLEESRISAQRSCTNRVVIADPHGKWNIMKQADRITKKEFEKEVGISFDDFGKALEYKFNTGETKPKSYEDISGNEFFKDVVDLVADNDLAIGDITKIDSFGCVDGKVVIRDFGLSKEVYNSLYNT